MGYYTNYAIEQGTVTDEELKEVSDCDWDGGELSNAKWYDHEKHMKELSRQKPDQLFCLSGEGEESGDLWKKYFKNGKMQVCIGEVVYPKFCDKELK
jgi:hypothetical protein